jgi:prolyl-tRNA editing enzyme YbaK/EbsC (Cys-tRNA(Pro) deacylase)
VTGGAAQAGISTVTRYLDEHRIAYDVVEHEPADTAADEARAAGVAPDHAAQTMALRDGERLFLAVIPASCKLDLDKTRAMLGAGQGLRPASDDELASAAGAEGFDGGALPPLGPLLPAPEVLDQRLLEHDQILFSGGDRTHGVLIDPNDLVEVVQPQVGDICAE